MLKLSYFNLEGLAEPIRLMFKVANVEFEDHRFSFEEWPALKATFPTGTVPVLVNPKDDMVMTQSNCILRYFGAQQGMYPSDAKAAYLVDEVIEMVGDLSKAMSYSVYVGMRPDALGHFGLEAEAKSGIVKQMRENLCKVLPDMLANLDKAVVQTGFLATGKVTIADLLVYCRLRGLKRGLFDHIPTDMVDSHANLVALYAKVEALPAVKAHYGL
jgi:glutathione S-transferase